MRRTVLVTAFAFAAIATASCSNSTYGGGSCTGTATNVSVCDNFYSPNASAIAAGSSITWTWRGSTNHSVTFQTGPVALGGSATMSSGTFTQTFTTPGTYTYQCLVHGAAMSGSVTVN